MATTPKILTETDQVQIVSAIREAELKTSGEIRVHIENSCKTDPVLQAGKVFLSLKMDKTELRNGVLIYVAVKDRKFAICGDEGINNAVPEGFWSEIRNRMTEHFKAGQFAEGIIYGVKASGESLKIYFPYNRGSDKNELTDDLSINDNSS